MSRRARLQVRIGRVTFDGVAPMRREAVREALEAELRRLGAPRRTRAEASSGVRPVRVNAGAVTLRPGAGAVGLGTGLARTIDAALAGGSGRSGAVDGAMFDGSERRIENDD